MQNDIAFEGSLSLKEIKVYLKIDHDDEDTIIIDILKSAFAFAESYTNRVFLRKSFTILFNYSDQNNNYQLKPLPILKIHNITLSDEYNEEIILSNNLWKMDITNTKIILKNEINISLNSIVKISFDAGYGDIIDDIPYPIIHGIKWMSSYLFENRDITNIDIPVSIQSLWNPYRVLSL